jgi:hypothetical protein
MIGSFLLLRCAEDRAEQLEVLVKIIAPADIVDDVIHTSQGGRGGYYQALIKTVNRRCTKKGMIPEEH